MKELGWVYSECNHGNEKKKEKWSECVGTGKRLERGSLKELLFQSQHRPICLRQQSPTCLVTFTQIRTEGKKPVLKGETYLVEEGEERL